ncbi:uncharacterized protein BN805_02042 [Prevotella sp. CAG:891]|jgi:hypothetical protein|nr:uncharacterized protein BN805_02042 [Prevotella sp. CAG:891]
MTKLWIISLPMLLLPVLTGCKGKTTSDPQQPATDSIQQTATATDSVRADTATEATTDEMRHIKKDVYAITKERIEGYDDFISSRKSFDLEWPEDVAACQNLSSLQQRLIKWMFEKKAQGTIDQIIKKETAQPLFANDDQCPDFTFINKDKYEATECMPLESDVSLKYYAHSPELIVFKYSFYIYEGGAHGYGASRYLTFMRKDAQVVSLKHLFGNHTDALLKIVNKEIKQAAAKNSTFYNEASRIDEWTITPKGITFVFNEGLIGSMAEGAVSIPLTTAQISALLTPEGKRLLDDAKQNMKVENKQL